MKKNWTMRVALLLVALTLITSCFVSGTFAKYVTSADASAQARVAKFGVQLTIDGGDLFAEKYATDDETYDGEFSVEAAENEANATVQYDKVVAPGTPAKDKGPAVVDVSATTKAPADEAVKPVTFGITGTPEVAVRVTFEFGEDFKDVCLPAGTYTDFTKVVAYEGEDEELAGTYGYYGTFTLTNDYYPVVFTLTQTKGATDDAPVAEPITGSLTQIVTALAEQFEAVDYDPNTVLDAEFTLTWEWVFETDEENDIPVVPGTVGGESVDVRDMADTFLGNYVAGVATDDNIIAIADDAEVSVEIAYSLTITVTQID